MFKRLQHFIQRITARNSPYPELDRAGGLSAALNNKLAAIGSPLQVSGANGADSPPFTYARVEKESRFSQVYIAAEERLYLTDFWKQGVCLAHGKSTSLNDLAIMIDGWLRKYTTTQELADHFANVILSPKARAFDEGREVDYTWNLLRTGSSIEALKPFIDIAANDRVLSTLFPFTSLNRLCFSRCTGFPYTYDTPLVIPIQSGLFEVLLPGNYSVGRGTAAEALKIVRDNLPLDIHPAVKGTAGDL